MEVLADGEDMKIPTGKSYAELENELASCRDAFEAGRALGRDEGLEEAANVADLSTVYEKDKGHNPYTWNYRIAKAIRALKEQT